MEKEKKEKNKEDSTKEQNKKLLEAIGKNVSTAVQSIDTILPEIDDDKFKEYLSKLNDEYNLLLNETQMIAKAQNIDLKLLAPMEKAKLWTGIKLNSLFDKSTRKFATMMFLGTNMGIPDLIIAICDFKDANSETITLAKKLKEIEEKSDEDIKLYLCR